jgi:hypothetical protein
LNQLADIQLKRSYLKDDLETIFEKSFWQKSWGIIPLHQIYYLKS